MERRRTYTPGTPTSSRQTATSARRREDPEWTDAAANVSSASSYEDLGKTSSNQEGSDLDIELTSSAGDEGLDRLGEASAPLRTRSSNASGVASPRRRRRPKRDRMQSLRRTAMGSRSKDGIQSDPEGQPSSERGADDSFLDLLEATKTFMAMHPRYSSTPRSTSLSSQLDQLAAQSMPVRLGREESTPRGRTIDLPCEAGAVQERVAGTDYHSPAPASMSASTNFDLSSSDSPPSHGLTSSRGGDEASKDDDEADPLATTPQPIASDPRLSSDASRDLATPRETGEAEKPPSRPLHESWLDWLGRHMRRVTVGISLVGLGVVLAVGVGLFRPPTIRRKYVLHNGIKHS